MKTLLLLFFALLVQGEEKIKIGDRYCTVKFTEEENAVVTLISLHDKENTAIEAYKMLPKEIKLNLLELKHNEKERNVFFNYNGVNFNFDPNRIFTEKGIDSTLISNNIGKKITKELIAEVTRFSKQLLSAIKKSKKGEYIIAAHNNNDGKEGKGSVSILNYSSKDHLDSKDIDEVHLSTSGMDEDDFVLVTQKSDFDFFKSRDVNVALYKTKPTDNDGSMSFYCITHNIPYINIEAQHGHIKEQTELIKMTYKLLNSK